MREIDELNFAPTVLYSTEHTWARQDADLVTIGISDYAQNQLGEIIFVELPQIGDNLSSNDVFGFVESVKAVSDLYMPIGGEVVEINSQVENSPESINDNPFKDGWMIKIIPLDPDELQQLMSAETYLDSLKG